MSMKALISLLVFLVICFSHTGALDRCLKTHRDKPCIATGDLPITLECRYPGQWFTVQKTEVKLSALKSWVYVFEGKNAASQCKKTKVSSPTAPNNYQCDVSSLGSHGTGVNARITYFCWEFDPDSLGGFGRKREKVPAFPWSDILEDIKA